MMSRKKDKPNPATMVAAANILIEGKPFAAGAAIEGVSREELAKAVSARRAVSQAAYAARFAPQAPAAEAAPGGEAGDEEQESAG